MENITFASTNQNKYLEVQSILSTRNISVNFSQIHLVEIQSDSLEEIAREKAKTAFAKVRRQVIVEADGLFIDSLAGRISDRVTEGGWGYDPIFVPDGTDLTFAELKKSKNEYSHRKRALEKFAQWYLKL